jgi:hypothetical protein
MGGLCCKAQQSPSLIVSFRLILLDFSRQGVLTCPAQSHPVLSRPVAILVAILGALAGALWARWFCWVVRFSLTHIKCAV